MRRTPFAAVVAALGLAVSLSTSVASPASASPESPRTAQQAGAWLGAPKAGQCYGMTQKQASDLNVVPTPAISCAKFHTSWVTRVGLIPADLPNDINKTRTAVYVSQKCRGATGKMVGSYGTEAFARSSYFVHQFQASKADRAEGARWFSCTVSSVAGPGTFRSTKLRTPVQVGATLPKRYQLCVNSRHRSTVSCDKAHDHAYAGSVTLKVGTSVSDREQQRASAKCEAVVQGDNWWWWGRSVVKGVYRVACLAPTR